MKKQLLVVPTFFIGILTALAGSGFNFDKLLGLTNNGIGFAELFLFSIFSFLILLAVVKIFWEKLDL